MQIILFYRFYFAHESFLYIHSISKPISRIKTKIIIVYFMFVLVSDIGNGNINEISMSKIKNRIMTKKNCIENDGITGFCVIKPHSKVFHFCNVTSVSKVITLINITITITNSILILVNVVIVIYYFKNLISIDLSKETITQHLQNANIMLRIQIQSDVLLSFLCSLNETNLLLKRLSQ